MGVRDDFSLWERELREPPERSGIRGMLLVAALVFVGCVGLIIMGDAILGIVGIVLAVLILVLWRLGM